MRTPAYVVVCHDNNVTRESDSHGNIAIMAQCNIVGSTCTSVSAAVESVNAPAIHKDNNIYLCNHLLFTHFLCSRLEPANCTVNLWLFAVIPHAPNDKSVFIGLAYPAILTATECRPAFSSKWSTATETHGLFGIIGAVQCVGLGAFSSESEPFRVRRHEVAFGVAR